jgi:hypothetical protein
MKAHMPQWEFLGCITKQVQAWYTRYVWVLFDYFGLFNKIIAYVKDERLNLSTLTLALTIVVTHSFQLSNPFVKIMFWPFHVNMHYYNLWFVLIGFFSQNTSNDKPKKK